MTIDQISYRELDGNEQLLKDLEILDEKGLAKEENLELPQKKSENEKQSMRQLLLDEKNNLLEEMRESELKYTDLLLKEQKMIPSEKFYSDSTYQGFELI